MTTVDCPNGCGYKIDRDHGKHPICPKVAEKAPDGKCVPWGKRIDLTIGERGNLPEDFVMPFINTTGKVKCGCCRKWVMTVHTQCDSFPGKTLPVSQRINLNVKPPQYGGNPPPVGKSQQKKSAYTPIATVSASTSTSAPTSAPKWQKAKWFPQKEAESNYDEFVYWVDNFTLREQGKDLSFANYTELTNHLVQFRNRIILCLNSEWFPSLTAELRHAHGIDPKVYVQAKKYYNYEAKDRFVIRILGNYAMTSFEGAVPANELVHKLSGMNLFQSKLTLAQFGYEWWYYYLNPCNVQILTGQEYCFSVEAYFGARICSTDQEWRSSLSDQIEAGNFTYEQLAAAEEQDVRYQLDVRSMYATAMKGLADFEVYYPVGQQRYLAEGGAEEFAKGTVGMYRVNYIRPPSLKIGVLPVRSDKKLQWPQKMGMESGVFTEVDIKLGIAHGYQFEFAGECLVWDQTGKPFDSFVDPLYALKQVEEDPDKRTVIKHLTVTLYGKMAQKATGRIEDKNRKMTEAEMIECLMNGTTIDLDADGDYCFRGGDGKKPQVNSKPNHLGCYILSWSRLLMMRIYECVGYEFDFSHTDSIRVSAANYQRLVAAGWVDVDGTKELGSLGVEYGIIYASTQKNCTNYQLKVLTKAGKCAVINKGSAFGGEELAEV